MYEVIVFDLDGTLLDTLDDLTGAVNAALSAFGLPARTSEEVRGFIGNGVAKLMERAVGIADFTKQDDVLAYFKDYYKLHCADKTKPYDGIRALLQTLQKRGVICAVLSNKADFAVKLLAEQYFPNAFAMAVGENEAAGIRKKPAPDALFSVLKTLDATKEKALYVGDSEVDIQTAKNAGVACVSVTWGFKDRAFLLKNGAKILIDAPLELLDIVGDKYGKMDREHSACGNGKA